MRKFLIAILIRVDVVMKLMTKWLTRDNSHLRSIDRIAIRNIHFKLNDNSFINTMKYF